MAVRNEIEIAIQEKIIAGVKEGSNEAVPVSHTQVPLTVIMIV